MFLIVLVVLFTMVMFLWLLSMLGVVPSPGQPAGSPNYYGWLAWFACLFLGITVFLTGFGVVVWDAGHGVGR